MIWMFYFCSGFWGKMEPWKPNWFTRQPTNRPHLKVNALSWVCLRVFHIYVLICVTNDTKWKNLGDLILLWQLPCGLYLFGVRAYPKNTVRVVSLCVHVCVYVCVCVCEYVCYVRLGAETAVSLFWIILDYRMGTQLQHGLTHTHTLRYIQSHRNIKTHKNITFYIYVCIYVYDILLFIFWFVWILNLTSGNCCCLKCLHCFTENVLP